MARSPKRTSGTRKIRYAVVGLGYIAQVAVLPAFAHAKKNSVLAALISDDPKKLKELGGKYGINGLYSYEPMSNMKNVWKRKKLKRCISRFPIICTANIPSELPKRAFMYCAKNPWPYQSRNVKP